MPFILFAFVRLSKYHAGFCKHKIWDGTIFLALSPIRYFIHPKFQALIWKINI